MTKKWLGSWPAKCDGCKDDLADYGTFYDARSDAGPWGIILSYVS
jgi:hypothetical protein